MVIKLPKQIICEDTLFTLVAIDEQENGYYMSADGGFIRATDLYVDEEILDENGIPHYDEYALNGLYFEYDSFGLWNEYVLAMLRSPLCQIFTEEMSRLIKLQVFKHDLENGWDYAIKELTNTTDNVDLLLLCQIYWTAYKTEDYKQSADPDDGLCYDIRSFAIHKILEVLENEN